MTNTQLQQMTSNLNICKDLGRKTVPWQSTITAHISLSRLKETEFRMSEEKWNNCGYLSPHLEIQDTNKNREKVIKYLETNVGKQGLVSIKDIAIQLNLTEEFVLQILKEFGMEITEE